MLTPVTISSFYCSYYKKHPVQKDLRVDIWLFLRVQFLEMGFLGLGLYVVMRCPVAKRHVLTRLRGGIWNRWPVWSSSQSQTSCCTWTPLAGSHPRNDIVQGTVTWLDQVFPAEKQDSERNGKNKLWKHQRSYLTLKRRPWWILLLRPYWQRRKPFYFRLWIHSVTRSLGAVALCPHHHVCCSQQRHHVAHL